MSADRRAYLVINRYPDHPLRTLDELIALNTTIRAGSRRFLLKDPKK